MLWFSFTPRVIRGSFNWLLFASFTFLVSKAQAALNDTGITTCSNATQNDLPCPVEGFPSQDAEYGTNSFDFTKLDANGNAMAVTATNHSCVQDNVTGLMWEVKTDDGGLRDKDNSYIFDQAATFAANVNATNLCGHKDWRVPNPHELTSIVDYSVYNQSIDEDFFIDISSAYFWTNAKDAAGSSYSWLVYFSYGYVYYGNSNDRYGVRLVRGEPLISSFNFTDKGDGTIKDNNTDLMWAKCSIGQEATDCSGSESYLTWPQALQAADSSTLAGYTDWRLPNVKELQTLVDYTKYGPSIDTSVFPNTPIVLYYSSSPYSAASNYSWFVNFDYGSIYVYTYDRYDSSAVRLVRSINTPVVTKPTVVTNAPSVITTTSARLNGTVNPNGAATTISFNFGPTTAYGTNIVATPDTIAATAVATSVSADKTGLTCGSTYHYQIKAANSAGITVGADQAFTTSACPRDLIVTNITLNPAKPVAGTAFSAVVIVKNQGTTATAASKLKLWTNLATVPVCTTVAPKVVDIAALAAGASVNVTVTGLTSNLVVSNTFRTFVDGTCVIGETNEANNHRTLNYRIGGRLADLVITNIALTPSAPVKNTMFNAAITVQNQGSAFSGSNFLDVWLNQATAVTCGAMGNTWVDVGGLAAGASTVVNVTGLNAGATGAKTLRAFVDSWCEEPESNETNNQTIKSYTVQ